MRLVISIELVNLLGKSLDFETSEATKVERRGIQPMRLVCRNMAEL